MQAEPIWNILLVDDDEDDYLLTKLMLSEMHWKKSHLEWVSTFHEGRQALATTCYDAVLMDYDLGTGSGLDLIREAAARDYPAPFILLTGRGSYEVDVEAMQAGVTLYLTKDEVNPLLLERSIRYAIERKRIEQGVTHILESIQDGFYAIDNNWQITYINRRAAQTAGYAPEELIGRNFWEAFPRLLGTHLEQYYRSAMHGRKSIKVEVKGIYQDAWYNISVYPFQEGISVYWQDITERKRTEDALRAEEATLLGILNATKESVWLFDPDGIILMANDTAISRIERPREEVIGKHFSQFMPADVAQARQARLRQTVESKHPVEFEDQRAGISFFHSFYPIFDSIGQVASVASFSRDITERKQVEQILKQRSEALEASRIETVNEKNRLEAVMASLPVGVAITDSRGGSIQANPAYEQLWGGPVRQAQSIKDYVAYKAWWADTGKPVQPEEWASAQAVMKGETVHGQILEIQRFDGRRTFVLNSASPVRDSNGEIIGSAVAIQDISRVKQSETLNKALNEINQILNSTLEFETVMERVICASSQALGSETAAISLRKGGRWVVSYVYGFPKDVIGTQMNDDEERHAVLTIQTRVPVAINDAFQDERVNRDHMRKWGVRSVLVVPILLRQEAIGVIFFNYQTSCFEFQENHILFGANLAASLSLALENARLFASLETELRERERAQAELLKSNKELEHFALVASHDLQEPLRKIEYFGNLLIEKAGPALGETERNYLERMQKASERMRKMIDGLLTLSRITSKGHTFISVDLHKTALAVLEDLEPRLRQTGGRVELGELPVIQADPTQMHQLLQNLIGNAVKFRKPDELLIVRVQSRQIADQWVEITVEDNGIGLDMKQASNLFQPFRRLHGNAEIEGTGIGLSICRKIVERHGGKLSVQSDLGKGSVLTVSLPVNQGKFLRKPL